MRSESHPVGLLGGSANSLAARVLAALLFFLTACQAQPSEDNKVAAVLKERERAEQTGDFNSWVALWSREKAGEWEKMRPIARPQPDRHYRASRIYVQGGEAAVLAQCGADSFVSMTLRKEDGQWKIVEQMWRNTAADANSVYALVPPEGGAFSRAGSPWDRVSPAMEAGQAARLGWQMRAVFDESFLYVRVESSAPLPAPGSTIERPPGGWPVMKVTVAGAGDFVLFDAVTVGDQATLDESGKAYRHRHYASYSMRLEHNDREIFSASADLQPHRLVEVTGRFFNMRIPLRAMGITDSRATRMMIGDAQWPSSAIVSKEVRRYPP